MAGGDRACWRRGWGARLRPGCFSPPPGTAGSLTSPVGVRLVSFLAEGVLVSLLCGRLHTRSATRGELQLTGPRCRAAGRCRCRRVPSCPGRVPMLHSRRFGVWSRRTCSAWLNPTWPDRSWLPTTLSCGPSGGPGESWRPAGSIGRRCRSQKTQSPTAARSNRFAPPAAVNHSRRSICGRTGRGCRCWWAGPKSRGPTGRSPSSST